MGVPYCLRGGIRVSLWTPRKPSGLHLFHHRTDNSPLDNLTHSCKPSRLTSISLIDSAIGVIMVQVPRLLAMYMNFLDQLPPYHRFMGSLLHSFCRQTLLRSRRMRITCRYSRETPRMVRMRFHRGRRLLCALCSLLEMFSWVLGLWGLWVVLLVNHTL